MRKHDVWIWHHWLDCSNCNADYSEILDQMVGAIRFVYRKKYGYCKVMGSQKIK